MVMLTEQIIKGKTRIDKLEEVRNLNLWGQDLDDCTILSKLPNLEVLSLSVNRLSSLKDFRHCTRLQELYLRKNDVRDLGELQHLVPLKELRVLWLSDNPCAEHPGYKQYVLRLLPNLQKLDNDDIASMNLDATPPSASLPAVPRVSAGSAQPLSPSFDTPNMDRPQSRGSAMLHMDRPQSRGSGFPSPQEPAAQNGSAAGYGPRQGGERGGVVNGGFGAGGGGGVVRNTKNILYAVMALLGELEDEDLVYVRREVEQRIGNRM